MATQAQIKDFLSKIAPIAVEQAKKHGNKIFPSICIAQACCESGFGTSPKMKAANAVFGIKVGKSAYHFGTAWKDKAYSTKTKECYDGRTYKQITDMFRAYDTIEESVEDYFDLLCTAKRYKYALNRSTPRECIEGIQKAPYATSPVYVNTIMTLVDTHGLTRFDNFSNVVPTGNPYPEPTKNVRLNSKGNDVRWCQWMLNDKGHYGLIIDGILGEKSLAALKDFQMKNNLVCDGVCGPLTRAVLKQ